MVITIHPDTSTLLIARVVGLTSHLAKEVAVARAHTCLIVAILCAHVLLTIIAPVFAEECWAVVLRWESRRCGGFPTAASAATAACRCWDCHGGG
ncbi:hypothetical protein K457DRAFT_142823 [Linnemannia elongata AG-77]|uniref:Uncharacterized protein n=1 Tax=Linnemannia elongata AG-77 TaxID=1314771 RepID=A0A197JDX5_9FUNG|nr:hypothetical protein K457DRAFT_142823 [Linnemannia elongata AG-77]